MLQKKKNGLWGICASTCAEPLLKNLHTMPIVPLGSVRTFYADAHWYTWELGLEDYRRWQTWPSVLRHRFFKLSRCPKPQKLELDDSVVFADQQTLNALLRAPLQFLIANIGRRNGLGKTKELCFRNRECIPTLDTLFRSMQNPRQITL